MNEWLYPILRLPRVLRTLAMTSFVWPSRWTCWDCHGFFQSLAMTSLWIPSLAPFVIAKAKGLWQSINHHSFIHSQKRKRNHYYLINQRINFQFLIFNFSLNPPVASQLPPLQREATPHKPLLTTLRNDEPRITEIATISAKFCNDDNRITEIATEFIEKVFVNKIS